MKRVRYYYKELDFLWSVDKHLQKGDQYFNIRTKVWEDVPEGNWGISINFFAVYGARFRRPFTFWQYVKVVLQCDVPFISLFFR